MEKSRLEVHHDGDIPAQSGLGTSAAFTVGLLNCLYALQHRQVGKRQLAIDSMTVDHDIAHEVTGYQDHIATAYGGLNLIKFGPGPKEFHIEPVITDLSTLQAYLMLFFTAQTRTSSDIQKAKLINHNEEHLHAQQKLVDVCLKALHTTDMSLLGQVLTWSWQFKKSMADCVSNPVIDEYMHRAQEAGAWGGKVVGAGGGGCLLFVVPPKKQLAVKKALHKLVYIPFHVEHLGSQLIYYEPGHDDTKQVAA